MKRPHYAWVICFACLLLYLSNMGLCSHILTIYLPFIEDTGLSHSMGSAILSVRCLSSFITTLFVSYIYKKLSLRKGIVIASLIGAAAPLVFYIGGSAFVYYIGAMLAGIAYGAGCLYPTSLLISNWFNTRKGLAIGISSAGSGVSTTIFAPIISSLIHDFSLRTAFLAQAGIMITIALIVFLLVRDTPSEMQKEPYRKEGKVSIKQEKAEAKELTPALLGILAFMMLLNGGVGLSFFGHLSVLTINCGYSAAFAARMVSLFGFVLIFSKLIAGNIADRIGTKKCSILLIIIFIAGCLFTQGMNGTDNFWGIIVFILLSLGAAVYNVSPPLLAGDLAPKKHYSKTLYWLQIFYNLGGIIFTLVPGIIADNTGSYKGAYMMFAAMMLISVSILVWVYKKQIEPRPKEN